jgi:hypothetical protein
MVMQLKSKLKTFLKKLLGIRRKDSNTQDTHALLLSYFNEHLEALLQGGWAIGLDDVEVINTEVDRFLQFGKLSILEFGGGASTLVFIIKTLDSSLNLTLHTVEENQDWIIKLQEIITLAPVPLDEAGIEFKLMKSEYHTDNGVAIEPLRGELLNQYDIILIDSPPDTIVDDGRLKTAEQCFSLLKERGCMLIHDTHRIMELFAVKRLYSKFYDLDLLDTCKGMGILRFPTNKKQGQQYGSSI